MNAHELAGTWRSYQAFNAFGSIAKHSRHSFWEISISVEGALTIKSISGFIQSAEYQPAEWQIKEWDKRRFLYTCNRKEFEIITFEQTDLVLKEQITCDKIFFSSLDDWETRLEPIEQPDANVYITLWSNSLIERIRFEQT